jgi:unsaturated rhamnogalacturonyl hydrolase
MKIVYLYIATILFFSGCSGQPAKLKIPHDATWSQRIAETFLLRHPGYVTYDSGSPSEKWNYEQGLMLVALHRMWLHSGEEKYIDFVKKNMNLYVGENGEIRTYSLSEYNLDNIGPGRALLELYAKTGEPKYLAAADTLRKQLREQPRTNEGGFWHKKIYPYQMWLDGLFMAGPFYTQYSLMKHDTAAFDDIANQFICIANHTKDSATGLFYHGWDESKKQPWSNPVTGVSPSFWGRAMGWYMMALVDVLDILPKEHTQWESLEGIFINLSESLLEYRDAETKLWYQVVNEGKRPGNYLETSASAMFAYAFAKGANRGYLKKEYLGFAEETFKGIIKHKVQITKDGLIDLNGTCRSAGLGGDPYRDGSFDYYMSEPIRTNDMKGIGPFLLAAIELEKGKEAQQR